MTSSKTEASTLLRRSYTRMVKPDESGVFVATIREFPGCVADGDSIHEAISRLELAAESWIEAAREMGQSIPEPLQESEYSGKFALRLPRSMHKASVERAAVEGTSVNQLFLAAIATYLGEVSGATKAMASTSEVHLTSAPSKFGQVLETFADRAVTGDTGSTVVMFWTSSGEQFLAGGRHAAQVVRRIPRVAPAFTTESSSSIAEVSTTYPH